MGFEMKSSQESAGVADMHAEGAEEQYFILTTFHALGDVGKNWCFYLETSNISLAPIFSR